jgi:hypothetical protein
MTADLADSLVPIAAELIGVVHDYGPADVAAVLARVPDGRHDALAVILAAMVNPDARPSELLAWTLPPTRSTEWQHTPTTCPDCGTGIQKGNLARHRKGHEKAAPETSSRGDEREQGVGVVLYCGDTTKDGPAGASTPVTPGLTPDCSGGS